MGQEIWKDIKGYEWLYQVSNKGDVKSLPKKWRWWHNWKILKWRNNWNWYFIVNLYKEWILKYYRIHRLVALTFLENPENKPCVNHKNWIRDDNILENLEWCTYSENMIHSINILWYKNHFHTNHPNKWKIWKLNHNSKKVNQYDLLGNFIKTWNSLRDIQRELWYNIGNISSCCRWKLKTAWWFIWKQL
jgi:hypothetical protein